MADAAGNQSPGDHLTSIHIQQAIKNDRESVAWLVSRFTPLLLCQAHHRLAPSLRRFCDPDDAVADVWMAVLPNLPDLIPAEGSLTRGLLRFASTVLTRRIRDLLEKHVINKPATLQILPCDSVVTDRDTRGVVTHVVAEERRGRIWASLGGLSEQDREILVLRGIEGRANAFVAARTGLTPENVAVRYHRALKRLRGLIPASIFDDLED
jgi:RNA polymerase sigma-70 factor (ECF subfamily)